MTRSATYKPSKYYINIIRMIEPWKDREEFKTVRRRSEYKKNPFENPSLFKVIK